MSAHETYLLDRCSLENSHTLDVYKANGGYTAIKKILDEKQTRFDVIDTVKASGIRGRGGAGFPMGLKWSFMPDPEKDPRPRFMALNADESEPGTCKDRVLMENDPHGVIEGCLIAAFAMQLKAVYIYVRGEYRLSYNRLQAAIDEARAAGLVGQNVMDSDFSCEIWMHKGAGAYICGEETGLMESLEGKRGNPRPKPPFPAGFGLWGNPTTVNNVESIFNAPFIINRGSDWFKTMGTEKSTGNFLCGISGHVETPGVYELPFGISAKDVLENYGGGVWKGRALKAWFPGGSSTGVLPASDIDVAMAHDPIKERGAMFGTASMIMMDETTSMAEVSAIIARFYEHESCGQCSQCREGTQWLEQIFHRIEHGHGTQDDIDLLSSLAHGMAPGKTICALADAAAIPTHSVIKNFRAELEEHVALGHCPLKAQKSLSEASA